MLSITLLTSCGHTWTVRSHSWPHHGSHLFTMSSPSTLQTFKKFCFLITCCLSTCIFISLPHQLCQPVRPAFSFLSPLDSHFCRPGYILPHSGSAPLLGVEVICLATRPNSANIGYVVFSQFPCSLCPSISLPLKWRTTVVPIT